MRNNKKWNKRKKDNQQQIPLQKISAASQLSWDAARGANVAFLKTDHAGVAKIRHVIVKLTATASEAISASI